MPLTKSSSKEAFSKNVSAEQKAGRPIKQSLAIAYRVQREAKDKGYARGGLISSVVPGRTDKIPTSVKPNSYIIPAAVVSGVGQGNTLAGANSLSQMFKLGPYGTDAPKAPAAAPRGMRRRPFANGGSTGDVDIVTAGGEMVIPPEKVLEIGEGDMAEGHAALDSFVKHVMEKTAKDIKSQPGPRKN